MYRVNTLEIRTTESKTGTSERFWTKQKKNILFLFIKKKSILELSKQNRKGLLEDIIADIESEGFTRDNAVFYLKPFNVAFLNYFCQRYFGGRNLVCLTLQLDEAVVEAMKVTDLKQFSIVSTTLKLHLSIRRDNLKYMKLFTLMKQIVLNKRQQHSISLGPGGILEVWFGSTFKNLNQWCSFQVRKRYVSLTRKTSQGIVPLIRSFLSEINKVHLQRDDTASNLSSFVDWRIVDLLISDDIKCGIIEPYSCIASRYQALRKYRRLCPAIGPGKLKSFNYVMAFMMLNHELFHFEMVPEFAEFKLFQIKLFLGKCFSRLSSRRRTAYGLPMILYGQAKVFVKHKQKETFLKKFCLTNLASLGPC